MAQTVKWPVGLLASAYLPSVHSQRVAMAICVGYFARDQSDSQPDRMTVAGYVSSKARWQAFDERWPRVLRAERLTTFSGSDFLGGTGEFATGWIDDPQRQIRLIRSLARLTERHVFAAFSCSMSMREFEAVDAEYRLSEMAGGAYGICAACLIARIQRWMAQRCPDDLTLFMLEDGDVDHREIRRVLDAEGVSSGEPVQLWPRRWTDALGRARCLRPFEACDLLTLPSMPAAGEEEIVDRERLLQVCGALKIGRRSLSHLSAESARRHVERERGRPSASVVKMPQR